MPEAKHALRRGPGDVVFLRGDDGVTDRQISDVKEETENDGETGTGHESA